MIKPKLFLAIDLKFNLTTNEQLKEISALKIWDSGLQKYLYIFPIETLNDVIALTCKELNFEEQKKEIINLIQHCPSLKQEIITKKYKGEGFLYIQRFPKMFRVKTVMRKQEQVFDIPIETVEATWRALLKYPANFKVKSKKLAEKWCEELKITRFNRQSGSFDGDKLYGTRNIYFQYYYSLKVLEEMKLIIYSKSGIVERIKDKWEKIGELITSE